MAFLSEAVCFFDELCSVGRKVCLGLFYEFVNGGDHPRHDLHIYSSISINPAVSEPKESRRHGGAPQKIDAFTPRFPFAMLEPNLTFSRGSCP
jgi:hypothetical protein